MKNRKNFLTKNEVLVLLDVCSKKIFEQNSKCKFRLQVDFN